MAILANSTRIECARTSADTRPARTVNFQDTFEMRYPENNLITGTNEEVHRAQRTYLNVEAPIFQNVEQNPPATSLLSESRGRGNHLIPHSHNATSVQRTADFSKNSQRQMDVGHVVRQWKIKFTGEQGSSKEEFIQRGNACRTLARLTDEDVLDSLTELLSGVALQWCRQARWKWRTWKDFCTAARSYYGEDEQFQQRLKFEAQARTQGKGEPVRDYIICLMTIMSKFNEQWSTSEQLDLLHRNMLPELRRLAKRSKARDVDDLVKMARKAEALIEAERNYKPPPPPKESLLPEAAFKPAKSKARNEPSIAVMDTSKSSDDMSALKQLSKQLIEQVQLLLKLNAIRAESPRKEPATKSRDTSNRNSSDRGKRSPKSRRKSTDKSPDSDKNKHKEDGPRSYVICWGCSWPGYTK